MPEFLKKDKGIIIVLVLLFILLLPFFYLKQGLLMIDTGREFYIPQQMLNGSVLYKDIYNIYGALSYQFNAVLMYVFGQKINVLYNAGIINSMIIIVTLYLLAREFLKKSVSFLFTVLIMFALVFQTFLYNSNLTYCFAIVYALSGFLLSVLFLIKYIKSEDTIMAYFSCLFAGISIANKYEFCIYPLIMIYVLGFLKPIGIKNGLKAAACFLLVPALSIIFLFLQGLNFNDVKENIILLNKLVSAPLIKEFFFKTGGFFNMSYLIGLIKNNQIFALFGILPVVNLVLFIIQFKEILKDKPKLVLILCAIAATAKSILYLNVNHMGIFIFPVCMMTFIILAEKYIPKFIYMILVLSVLIFAVNDFTSLEYKKYKLHTEKGKITAYSREWEMISTALHYIPYKTNTDDRIVILPEGVIINYLTDRRGDNFFYNLSPLFYNDVFGEEKVINHFSINMPEYFIILPINNIEYGSEYFGKDYAQKFYNMIVNNYDLVKRNKGIEIFKRKKQL